MMLSSKRNICFEFLNLDIEQNRYETVWLHSEVISFFEVSLSYWFDSILRVMIQSRLTN